MSPSLTINYKINAHYICTQVYVQCHTFVTVVFAHFETNEGPKLWLPPLKKRKLMVLTSDTTNQSLQGTYTIMYM